MMLAQSNPPEEHWLAVAGGPRIFTRHWRPAGAPQAALVICHGVNSHGGQYQRAAAQPIRYQDHYHDLLNDLGRERVMGDIVGWTGARLPQAADGAAAGGVHA